MFPDFKGEVSKAGFSRGSFLYQLQGVVDRDDIIMPVINGLASEEAEKIYSKAAELGTMVTPVISERSEGLRGTLEDGYETALASGADIIVRLDTVEHPPTAIPRLVRGLDADDVVVGDLDFSQAGLLIVGTADEVAHLEIFPALYGQFTRGKVALSCAHGFQAFRRSACKQALANAKKIVDQTSVLIDGPVTWGFDGAMVLGAIAAGISVKVCPVPAESLRNREAKKVGAQFKNALTMCRAAAKIFPEVIG